MQYSVYICYVMGVAHFFLMKSSLTEHCSSLSCKQRNYSFVNYNMTWSDAQSYCTQNYTDLASIDNMEEMSRLLEAVNGKGSGKAAWIGLQKGATVKWQWSLPGEDQYIKNNTHWKEGEPNDVDDDDKNCVNTKKENVWHLENCDESLHFVCYNKNSSEEYKVINEKLTWAAAQSYCRENYTDLVSGRNQTENIVRLLDKENESQFWIGLFRDSWEWSDGNNSSFRYWNRTDRVKGNCAVTGFNLSDKWEDELCDELRFFFCYTDFNDNFVLIREKMTWAKALSHCREEYHDLVSVHHEDIQKLVAQQAKEADTPYVWLGLRYTCTLDYWFWVSGQSLCYQNWAPGNGSGWQECGMTGAIEKGGDQRWVDRSDKEELNFICTKTDFLHRP